MPALTKEELEARKRARNSRIIESRVDRMAIVQDTTADRVTMPEEYYRQPNRASEQPTSGQQQGAGAQMPTRGELMDSLLRNNVNFSELLNSLSPEMRQALESRNVTQMLSSLRSMLPGVSSSSPEEAKKQKKAGMLAVYVSIMFYVLAAFSSLVRVCIAHYATSSTARWITRHTIGPLFTFFHTVRDVEDFPHIKFRLGLFQLIIMSLMTYYGLVYKAAGMSLMPFLSVLFRGIISIIVIHVLVHTILWCVVYIGH